MGAPILAILLAVATPSAATSNAPVVTNVAASAAIATQPVRAAQGIQPANQAAPAYGSTNNDVHIPPVDISGAFEARMLELSG